MLKAFGSSSSSGCFTLPRRLRNPHYKFFLISRKPIEPAAVCEPSRTHSLASRFCKGRFFRAYQLPHDHPLSIPGASPYSSSAASIAIQASDSSWKINFCQWCGGPTTHEIPDGEDRMRAICTECGEVTYENPKMDTSYWIHGDGESAADGAARETWEEANAEVEVLSQFVHLDIPLISQTYIIFLAKLKRPHFRPGPESLECRLFALEDIPLHSLAFSSMLVTLKLYMEDRKLERVSFHYGVINKRPGSGPSAIHAYSLDHHLRC